MTTYFDGKSQKMAVVSSIFNLLHIAIIQPEQFQIFLRTYSLNGLSIIQYAYYWLPEDKIDVFL